MNLNRTKQGDEVDFILLKNRKPIPIEVKSKLPDIEIPKGMRHFLNRYSSIETAYVINENISDNIHFNSCKIKFITFKALGEICR